MSTKKVDEVVEEVVVDQAQAVTTVKSESFLNFEETVGDAVENRLKFKPRPHLGNITQAFLVETTLKMIEVPLVKKDGLPSTYEYAGCVLPNLRLEFIQVPTTEDPAARYMSVIMSPYATMKSNGELLKHSSILDHYKWEYLKLRHIANAFKSHPNFDKTVTIPGFDPLLPAIERVEGLTKYYAAWAKMLGGKDGKGFANQMNNLKVVANSQTQTYLTIPDYVGEGFIEKTVENRMPTIELKPNETTILVKSEKKGSKGSSSTASAEQIESTAQVSDEIQKIMDSYK